MVDSKTFLERERRKIELYEATLTIHVLAESFDHATDAEIEDLTGKIEDEIDMGLAAVGKSIVGKLGNGRLSYKVR